jgi:hypothetical protein
VQGTAAEAPLPQAPTEEEPILPLVLVAVAGLGLGLALTRLRERYYA